MLQACNPILNFTLPPSRRTGQEYRERRVAMGAAHKKVTAKDER